MSEDVISVSRSKKDPPTGVRVLLHILSVLLWLCLCVSLTATALILDFRLVTAEDNIRLIANSLLGAPPKTHHLSLTAAVGVLRAARRGTSGPQEQMQTFLDQSTTKEYPTDKITSYMNDFINWINTTITTEELDWLIEENNAAIETQLGVKMDDTAREQVLSFVEEINIGEVIRTEVIEKVEDITLY